MPLIEIIDAHQHFWDLSHNDYPWLSREPTAPFRYGDYDAIRRNYLPADYSTDTANYRVRKTVHVEAEWNCRDPIGEQRWLTRLMQEHGLPSVSVAQAWLDREDVAETLAELATLSFVRGIRHKPRAAQDPRDVVRGMPGSMDDPVWRTGYALLARYGFSFDLQTPFWHCDAAAELARDFPTVRMIINHTFLPVDRSAEGLAAWRRALETVAAAPNVALKISGLGIKGKHWSIEDNRPVIQDALRIVGVERCMFASNYPVDSLVGTFDTIYSGFDVATAGLPATARRALFCENAARIYRIAA